MYLKILYYLNNTKINNIHDEKSISNFNIKSGHYLNFEYFKKKRLRLYKYYAEIYDIFIYK